MGVFADYQYKIQRGGGLVVSDSHFPSLWNILVPRFQRLFRHKSRNFGHALPSMVGNTCPTTGQPIYFVLLRKNSEGIR